MMQQRSMSHLAHSLGIRQDYKNAGHYLRKVSVFFSKDSGLAGKQVRAEYFLLIYIQRERESSALTKQPAKQLSYKGAGH